LNNKDREHLAYFLVTLENNLGNTTVIESLINNTKLLNDTKLNELVEDYREYENDITERTEMVIERAIELWKKDFPDHSHFRWELSRSFSEGNYQR